MSVVTALHQKGISGALWSINALAEEFGTGWNQVNRALKGVPPDGEIKGKPAWKVSTAAQYLVKPIGGDADGPKSFEDMDPKDRLDWVKSERELMKMREEAGMLLSIDDHRDGLANMAKLFVTALDTLPDVLEREAGLSPKQTERAQRVCDKAREAVYELNAREAGS